VVKVTVEQALVQGDLAALDPEQRVNYYLKVCSSLGLNPYTKPFDDLAGPRLESARATGPLATNLCGVAAAQRRHSCP
jgi:hypothetical protein